MTTDSPTTDSPTPTPRQYWGPTHYQPSQPPPYAAPYAPPKKRHRIRNTILIVAAVFVGIGVISAVANGAKSTTHPVVSGVQTQSNNETHPPQADVNPGWTLASEGFDNYAKVTGTVTNHSSKTSTYTLHFDLIGSNGVRLDDTTAIVNEVQPGQTANFETFPVQAAGAHATLTTVDRMGF